MKVIVDMHILIPYSNCDRKKQIGPILAVHINIYDSNTY